MVAALAMLVLTGCLTQDAAVAPSDLRGLRASTLDGGRRHMCAITTDHSLECWGANSFGQTGDGNVYRQPTRPRPVLTLRKVLAVSAGDDFTCALDDRGAPWCWGQNESGQLGNGARITLSLTPAKVLGGVEATQLATGDLHTCALGTDGAVTCWGLGAFGQIGDGTREDRYRPRQVLIPDDVTAIAAGANHTCAIVSEGGVACWGLNRFGQLGDGSRADAAVPRPVAALGGKAVQLAAGDDFTCARLEGGRVRCWGSNDFGQLGHGTRSIATRPTDVVGIRSAVDLTAAGRHACVALADGEVRCWGADESGQLGDHGSTDRAVPVRARVARDARRVAATDAESCAIDRAGRVTCWGPPA
jgi:alpha-tubulin suppressor-like RCC1 family protein